MACPQCEWEFFQTGRYEPILHGRRKTSSEISHQTASHSFHSLIGAKAKATQNNRHENKDIHDNDNEHLCSRGSHITTRISQRRKSSVASVSASLSSSIFSQDPAKKSSRQSQNQIHHHHPISIEHLTGDLISNNSQQNAKFLLIMTKTRQSLCQICSLDLRKYSYDHFQDVSPITSTISTAISSQQQQEEVNEGEVKQDQEHSPPQQSTRANANANENFKFEFLNILCTIGTGTFGRVKLVQHQLTNQVYALKCMLKEDIVQYHQHKNIINEKNILLLCYESSYISKLYATYNRPNAIYMLMEYIQGGELLTHLYDRDDTIPHNEYGGFMMTHLQFYLANLVNIFLFFQQKNILYRDLKPENILLDRYGWIKIVDFGFSKQLQIDSNSGNLIKTFTLCGTQNYLAPEMILAIGYDNVVDYWALGCLMYELLLASTPFDEEFIVQTYQKITSYKWGTLTIPEEVDPSFTNLLNALLVPDPNQRLGRLSRGSGSGSGSDGGSGGGGVQDIQNHEFFHNIDWNSLLERSCPPPYVPHVQDELDTSNFFDFDNQESGDGPLELDETLPYEGRQDYFVDFASIE